LYQRFGAGDVLVEGQSYWCGTPHDIAPLAGEGGGGGATNNNNNNNNHLLTFPPPKATGGIGGKGNRLKFIKDAVQRYGGRKYRQWNGPMIPMVVLTHPDLVGDRTLSTHEPLSSH
jgi:hypothetical protein